MQGLAVDDLTNCVHDFDRMRSRQSAGGMDGHVVRSGIGINSHVRGRNQRDAAVYVPSAAGDGIGTVIDGVRTTKRDAVETQQADVEWREKKKNEPVLR